MQKTKKLSKYFIIFFLVAFFAINWSDVSWIFNSRVVSGFVTETFQGNQTLAESNQAEIEIEIEEEAGIETSSKLVREFETSQRENSIEIPKIDIEAPLIVDSTLNDDEVFKALDRGVVYYPASVLPGRNGQTIILGHSAPPGWPRIQYQWVFSELDHLKEGDKIFVYFDNKKYSFSVKDKVILERGGDLPEYLTNSDNVLILITCWPPGKDIMRMAVVAS